MGIRRRTVTWFAVIHGLPGAGTGRPYLKAVVAETTKGPSCDEPLIGNEREAQPPEPLSVASVTQYEIT